MEIVYTLEIRINQFEKTTHCQTMFRLLNFYVSFSTLNGAVGHGSLDCKYSLFSNHSKAEDY